MRILTRRTSLTIRTVKTPMKMAMMRTVTTMRGKMLKKRMTEIKGFLRMLHHTLAKWWPALTQSATRKDGLKDQTPRQDRSQACSG